MAFTDEQFDARLSPMFRSMRPAGQPRSPLNGLLSAPSQAARQSDDAGMVSGPQTPDYQMPNPEAAMPSRAQMLSQPARTQYAKTTPPATAPQQVWQSPSLQYPTSMMQQPVGQSVTAGLLDSPAATVASGINATPMSMPPSQAPAFDESQVIAPPPPEAEVLIPQGGSLAVRPPEYLAPIQYIPLQPSRRYEVI